MMLTLLKILPRKQMSRLAGKIMHWRGPQWWARLSIRTFAKMYNIRVFEASESMDSYKSIGEFFVRNLRDGARTIGDAPILHCADSVINSAGVIDCLNNKTQLIQAKGLHYSLEEFLCDPTASERFLDGQFATYYLCPTDYHRVHSPMTGTITHVKWVPGDLWPVNNASVQGVPNLFVRNERVIVEIKTPAGVIAMVFVGAINVGSIHIKAVPELRTNQEKWNGNGSKVQMDFAPQISVSKGDEVGHFSMGSTIVMVWSKSAMELLNSETAFSDFKVSSLLGKAVQVRENINKVRGW